MMKLQQAELLNTPNGNIQNSMNEPYVDRYGKYTSADVGFSGVGG
jgi:hypothetical protein